MSKDMTIEDTQNNGVENCASLRLSKYVSNKYNISRRQAEDDIKKIGAIINGKQTNNPSFLVAEGDEVIFENKNLKVSDKDFQQEETRLYVIYKPTGCIVSRKDERDRKTIYHLMPVQYHNLHYIGRLDYNSEGVLLLTNNGSFARRMENPDTQIEREYRVRVSGNLDEEKLNRIRKGVYIQGESYKPELIEILKENAEGGRNFWIRIILCEGKNREIRKLLEHFNIKVSKLIRMRYGLVSMKNIVSREAISEVPYHITRKQVKLCSIK